MLYGCFIAKSFVSEVVANMILGMDIYNHFEKYHEKSNKERLTYTKIFFYL